MNARFALKRATDAVHDELDRRLSSLDLGSAEGYRTFLFIQARVVPPLEAALDRFGLADHVEGWSSHHRAHLLAEDLAVLDCALPEPVAVPAIVTLSQALGCAYVLEGSRLGGRLVSKRVRPEMPTSFLNPTKQAQAWPALVEALDSQLTTGPSIQEAKQSAYACFELFLGVAKEQTA